MEQTGLGCGGGMLNYVREFCSVCRMRYSEMGEGTNREGSEDRLDRCAVIKSGLLIRKHFVASVSEAEWHSVSNRIGRITHFKPQAF